MDGYSLLLIPVLAFCLPTIVYLISSAFSNTFNGKDELYSVEDKAGRYGLNSNNPEIVKKYIRNLESSYSSFGGSASPATRTCCNATISDLYSHHDSLIEDRWSGKAWKYLDGIEVDLAILLGGDLSATDIVNVQKIKNHILSQYDSYWKWTEKCADECESQNGKSRLWDQAREDMKSKLSSDYFDTGITTWWGTPSNKSVREQLEKRLNGRLAELRPEYLRKQKLMKDMVAAVAAEETMLRADLMKLPFDAVSEREVSSVYRVLVKTGRLFEMKVGSRYIVSLSDKELARKHRGQKKPAQGDANVSQSSQEGSVQHDESAKPDNLPTAPGDLSASATLESASSLPSLNLAMAANTAQKPVKSFTKTELIAFLDSKHMEYVDKAPAGGCFWILAGPNADSFIKEIVVDGAKPVYAKNAKALNNRPGWFIKLGQPGKGPVNQAAYAAAQTQIH